METALQKKGVPMRQLSLGPRLYSGLHLASKEQKQISPGDSWSDSLADPTALLPACPPRPVARGRGALCWGWPRDESSKECLFWGHVGVRAPQAWFSARNTVCPANGCTWKGQLGGQQHTSRSPPPPPPQVSVQLCKKCRAWKSLGEIAGYLECKHFPGKGGQGS